MNTGSLRVWNKWFAWYPILIDGKRIWWKTIERKLVDIGPWYHTIWAWEYRNE